MLAITTRQDESWKWDGNQFFRVLVKILHASATAPKSASILDRGNHITEEIGCWQQGAGNQMCQACRLANARGWSHSQVYRPAFFGVVATFAGTTGFTCMF